MKICCMPSSVEIYTRITADLPPKPGEGWLRSVRALGFDGIELPSNCVNSAAQELRTERWTLPDYAWWCVGGAGFCSSAHSDSQPHPLG